MTDKHTNQNRLIIFDCDGVLVDTEAVVVEIESQYLTAAGFPMTIDEVAETCVGLGANDMATMLESRFGRAVPDGLEQQIQARSMEAFSDRLQGVAGLDSLLAASSSPRCIASNSNLDRIRFTLGLTGLDVHFDPESIFSAEMVRFAKPAPDLFLHAAEKMSFAPSDCIVVEDSPHGISGAVAAGMAAIGFVGGGHARPSLSDRLVAAGAIEIANNAAELADLLSRPL